MRPKMIDGQPLTGEMFAELITEYVKAFNGGVAPEISSAWGRVIQMEIDKVMNICIENYKRKVAELTEGKLPKSLEEMKRIDEEAKRSSYRIFYESGVGAINSENHFLAREKMESVFTDHFHIILNENEKISRTQCEEIFMQLYKIMKDHMDKLEVISFDVLSTTWKNLRSVFFSRKYIRLIWMEHLDQRN